MSNFVNNNGQIISASDYSIMAGNRSYIYGDGLFESIRIINGKLINLDNHYKRLIDGMRVLKIKQNENFTFEFFKQESQKLVENNKINQGGRLRFSVDRKPGGTFLPENNEFDYFIECFHLDDNLFRINDYGLEIDLYEEIKKSINFLSNYKTKSSLLYVMANLCAQEKNMDDLLIQNNKFSVIEGSSSNLFIVSNGVLYTPGLETGCLGGTMRMQVINIALENNIKVYECNLTPQNLLVADEVFLTNAIKGINWVGSYRNKKYFNYLSTQLLEYLNNKWKNI